MRCTIFELLFIADIATSFIFHFYTFSHEGQCFDIFSFCYSFFRYFSLSTFFPFDVFPFDIFTLFFLSFDIFPFDISATHQFFNSYLLKKKFVLFIVTKIYGADNIKLSEMAEKCINLFTQQDFNDLPICIAKTPLSLSHDPSLKSGPKNFFLPIHASIGADFLYPLVDEISTIPGLPTCPCFYEIDIDTITKEIFGLF